MNSISILEDLFKFNSWAHARLIQLCDGLADSQLDEKREMGLGSLRNTLFHNLLAEEIWLERWLGMPWRTFPMDADGLPLSEIARRFDAAAAGRQELMDRERGSGWTRICNYKDSRGTPHSNVLGDLLLHVANHGIHHRAQALHYLKQFERTVPGGLDYLFYRIAKPYLAQDPETVSALRQFGLEVATGSSPALAWDSALVKKYFAYGDWANAKLLELSLTLDDVAVDRDWKIGMSSIRSTALHVYDAERWWWRNWTDGTSTFDKSPPTLSFEQLREDWSRLAIDRNQFIGSLNPEQAQRMVTAIAGGPLLRFTVVESAVQLCGHGTHHRAQWINMLRHSGQNVPAIDFGVFARE